MPLILEEDDFTRNLYYASQLPCEQVQCSLKLKDDMVVSGLGFFFEIFNFFLKDKLNYEEYLQWEGKAVLKKDKQEIKFELPFNIALSGERVALNLLQMSSSISSYANKFAVIAAESGINVLDTRKTTPLYRSLEKYAVRIGGCYNHRFGQADVFMIKDNHKSFFGGIEPALNFFRSVGAFYQDVVVEIHNLIELNEAIQLGVKHIMLDNFEPEDIKKAISLKQPGMTFEVSGGINLNNLKNYCIDGVDAISVGSITYGAPKVDISLKY